MTTETAADRFAPRYFSIPDAKLADLKVGMMVRIVPATGTAAEIRGFVPKSTK